MLYRNFDFVEVKVSEAKPYMFKTSAKIILLFEYNKRLTTFFKMEKQLLLFLFQFVLVSEYRFQRYLLCFFDRTVEFAA